MVTDEYIRSREWCVFRNLVHTVYREARHLGPERDLDAKVHVSSGHPLFPKAKLCYKAREELKSRHLYELTAQARSTADVLRPYREKTDLTVDELISAFKLQGWKPSFGGPCWAKIAETLKELISALEAEDFDRVSEIADRVFRLHHNTGYLVPSRAEWERSRYLQEKWPELCDSKS
jgi:hypothetical protein